EVSPPGGGPAGPPESPGAGPAFRRVGKFHLLLLHFPIALLLAAAAGEVASALRGGRGVDPAVRFCARWGAAAAVPASLCAWLSAGGGAGAAAPGLLAGHRGAGTAAAAWAVVAALVLERDARRGTRTPGAPLVTLAGALLVAAAAHWGGELVHGEDFF